MKPEPFRPWAQEQFAKSVAVASVDGVQDEQRENAHITYTHVTLATGAKIVIHWVGSSPPVPVDPDNPVTGQPPAPVKVPELATSGRLRTADIEEHLAALLNNGGHEQVLDVTGYSADPKLGGATQPYGIRIRFHDESIVYGLFRHTLSKGQQPGQHTEFNQREEV